MKMQFEKQKT